MARPSSEYRHGERYLFYQVLGIFFQSLWSCKDSCLPHAMLAMEEWLAVQVTDYHNWLLFHCMLCSVQFILKENKPWLVAYNELDPSDRPSAQRPHGQPLIFIPGDTVGDPITSEVINGAPALAVAFSMKTFFCVRHRLQYYCIENLTYCTWHPIISRCYNFRQNCSCMLSLSKFGCSWLSLSQPSRG